MSGNNQAFIDRFAEIIDEQRFDMMLISMRTIIVNFWMFSYDEMERIKEICSDMRARYSHLPGNMVIANAMLIKIEQKREYSSLDDVSPF